MADAGDEDQPRRFRDAALPYLDDVFTLARYLMRDGPTPKTRCRNATCGRSAISTAIAAPR